MSQSTRRWISEKVQSLRESNVLPFHDILDAEDGRGRPGRRRGHLPRAHLHPPGDHLPVPLPGPRPRPLLPRRRRPADRLAGDPRPQALRAGDRQLLRGTPAAPAGGRRPAGPSDRPGDRGPRGRAWLWKGRRVDAGRRHHRLDARHRGEPGGVPAVEGPRAGLGFPLARMVAVIALATGVVRDLAMGPYEGKETGETALFRALLGQPGPGRDRAGGPLFRLVLRDRGAVASGASTSLFRMHQRRKFDFRRGRRLGVEDHVVDLDQAGAARMDGRGDLCSDPRRRWRCASCGCRVEQPGFRVDELVVVTTLLDPRQSTKEELAELYRARWNVEKAQADSTSSDRWCVGPRRSVTIDVDGVARAGRVVPAAPDRPHRRRPHAHHPTTHRSPPPLTTDRRHRRRPRRRCGPACRPTGSSNSATCSASSSPGSYAATRREEAGHE